MTSEDGRCFVVLHHFSPCFWAKVGPRDPNVNRIPIARADGRLFLRSVFVVDCLEVGSTVASEVPISSLIKWIACGQGRCCESCDRVNDNNESYLPSSRKTPKFVKKKQELNGIVEDNALGCCPVLIEHQPLRPLVTIRTLLQARSRRQSAGTLALKSDIPRHPTMN